MSAANNRSTSPIPINAERAHWDRGRLARNERAARTAVVVSLESSRADGARSGRDARGPSEEREWLSDSSENFKAMLQKEEW